MVLEPNTAHVAAHLSTLYAAWDDVGYFEVRALHCDNRQPPRSRWFKTGDVAPAAAFVAASNRQDWNLYVTPNPVQHGYSEFGSSSRDDDVIAARVLFLDADTTPVPELLSQITAVGLIPSFCVLTGSIPHTRLHLYFVLDELTLDLAEWRDTQSRAAMLFQTDKKVCNPSRLLRIGGTVSYPSARKQKEEGRVPELTELIIGDLTATTNMSRLRRLLPVPAAPEPPEAGVDWAGSCDGEMPLEAVRAALDVIPPIAGTGQHNTHIELATSVKGANRAAFHLFHAWQRRGNYQSSHARIWASCPEPSSTSFLGLLKHAKRANPDWWRANAEAEAWWRSRLEQLQPDAALKKAVNILRRGRRYK